jgi:hypothetical protein
MTRKWLWNNLLEKIDRAKVHEILMKFRSTISAVFLMFELQLVSKKPKYDAFQLCTCMRYCNYPEISTRTRNRRSDASDETVKNVGILGAEICN